MTDILSNSNAIHSSNTTASKRIASLEFGRVFAILAIALMHCGPMYGYWHINEEPWVAIIFNQITRFGVPLFFLISGYLIQPKLAATPFSTWLNYSKPLVRMWLVWSVICLAVPFRWGVVMEHGYQAERAGYIGWLMEAPLNAFMEGGLVHLWFLPSLIMAVGIVALCYRYRLMVWLLPLATGLYVYGVLAGSYVNITELSSPFFTRNGPFFSTLLVAVGVLIREKNIKVDSRTALLIALVGMLIHLVEGGALTLFEQPMNSIDYAFGTVFWGAGLFMWLLANPNVGNQPWIQKAGPRVLGFYLSHMLFIIISMNISGMMQLGTVQNDLFVVFGMIVFTSLFVVIIEKSPLQRWLFR